MNYLIGWFFDLWRDIWYYVGEVMDDALDVWGDDE